MFGVFQVLNNGSIKVLDIFKTMAEASDLSAVVNSETQFQTVVLEV